MMSISNYVLQRSKYHQSCKSVFTIPVSFFVKTLKTRSHGKIFLDCMEINIFWKNVGLNIINHRHVTSNWLSSIQAGKNGKMTSCKARQLYKLHAILDWIAQIQNTPRACGISSCQAVLENLILPMLLAIPEILGTN